MNKFLLFAFGDEPVGGAGDLITSVPTYAEADKIGISLLEWEDGYKHYQIVDAELLEIVGGSM